MVDAESEAVDDYEKALDDLTCNSKPHINMLTMLAEEKKAYATKIVQIIESRIYQVPVNQKLPILYLIDSVVKNCPDTVYKDCFAKNLIKTFGHVFEKGDEKMRGALFKLRTTWTPIFPASKLYGIDIKVHSIDPAWPVTEPSKLVKGSASESSSKVANKPAGTSVVHVNPKFLGSDVLAVKSMGAPSESKEKQVQQQKVQVESQNVDIGRRIQKEPFQQNAPTNVVRPVNQNFVQALNASSNSRDPRIRSAAQKRTEEEQFRPTKPATVSSTDASSSYITGRKVFTQQTTSLTKTPEKKNDDKTINNNNNNKPASVVAKVSPAAAAKVSLEPGRWSFRKDTTVPTVTTTASTKNNPLADVKIAKLSPSSKKTTNQDYIAQTSVLDSGSRRGAGAAGNRSFRGGRGGGGQQSYNNPPMRDNNNGESPRKVGFDRETNNRMQIELQKRRRSRSPPEEDNYIVKSKRDRSLIKSRRDEVDVSPTKNDVGGRKPTSTPIRSSLKTSYLSADADLRNNSTDSDRSSRDVDLRTLPLKKRKRSDEGSTSTEGFPLDQVLPKEKRRPVKSEPADLDELLFGADEDFDMRYPEPRPKVDNKRVSAKLSADTSTISEDSLNTSAEYKKNIYEKQPAESSLSPRSYGRDVNQEMAHTSEDFDQKQRVKRPQAPYPARKPKSAPTFPSSRPKMRPIPKTSPSSSAHRPSAPVYQSPSGSGKIERQSLLPGYQPRPMTFNNPTPPVGDRGDHPVVPDVIPSNNLIYVDGQSYDVRYINDWAVIERNGAPHRLRFVGVGRNVVIDNIVYHLKFEETKEILIDGQVHKIRFGGPSRELYMGNYPFRGSFGGPPIFATVNGVKHKIQLSGPPPEVKIDPEPSHDLLLYVNPPVPASNQGYAGYETPQTSGQFYPQQKPRSVPHQGLLPTPAYQPMSAPPVIMPPVGPIPVFTPSVPPPTVPPKVDVHDLLSKLLTTGIINAPQASKTAPVEVQKEKSPIRIEIDDNATMRLPEPTVSLKEFNMKALKIRYTSVVNALYQEKLQCTTCGMRFLVGDQQKYSKHLDWHFKQNRLDKLPGRSTSRPWYFAWEDWVNFEEFADDKTPKAKSEVFESSQNQQEGNNRFIPASTDSVIIATRDDQNECSVCHEKFEQFWDENEEEWKLRNAMLVDEKAYHPLCYQDVSNVDRELCSPGFESPVNEKPVFWACADAITASEVPVVKEELKKEAETMQLVPQNEPETDPLELFLAENLPKDDEVLKKSASSQDLLQSVLSVVSNVPLDLVDSLTQSPYVTVNKEKSFGDDEKVFNVNNDNDDNVVSSSDCCLNYDKNASATESNKNEPQPSAAADKNLLRSQKQEPSSDDGSSGGTTPLRDELPDSPGTPVHDETAIF